MNSLIHYLHRTRPIPVSFPIFLLILLFVPGFPDSRDVTNGYPLAKNYTPPSLSAISSHSAVIQDRRGFIYVTTEAGLMEFDGLSWRLVTIANLSPTALAITDDGRIYVGARSEFGYLTHNASGQMHYKSLIAELQEANPDFDPIGEVFSLYANGQDVYIHMINRLYKVSGKKIQTWMPGGSLSASFQVEDDLYFASDRHGLMKLKNDALQQIPGARAFLKLGKFFILPDKAHQADSTNQRLVVLSDEGIYRYDAGELIRLERAFAHSLNDDEISTAISLPDKGIAIGTVSGAILILDKQNHLIHTLNVSSGLPDSRIQKLHIDPNNGLWIFSKNEVMRTEILSPYMMYGQEHGLDADIISITRFDGKLYAATNEALYEISGPRVEAIEGPYSCFQMRVCDGKLYVTSSTGLFEIRKGRAIPLLPRFTSSWIHAVYNPGQVYVGFYDSIVKTTSKEMRNILQKHPQSVGSAISTMLEGPDGSIWICTTSGYVLRMDATETIHRYSREHGLPGGELTAKIVAGFLTFETRDGLYSFDEESQRFEKDRIVGARLGYTAGPIYRTIPDSAGHIWAEVDGTIGREWRVARKQADGSYIWKQTPLHRFNDLAITAVYQDSDNVLWFGVAGKKLIRYASDLPLPPIAKSPPAIRRVLVNQDSLIYGGTWSGRMVPSGLDYTNNSIRLDFAVPYYDQYTSPYLQWKLDGYDDRWTSWRQENHVTYTNLQEGSYLFRVRTRHADGQVSPESMFAFNISPPWYRIWWMYLLYILGTVLLIYGIVKWRSRRLEQDKLALERTVAARTAEVAAQNKQLQIQAERLQEMDQIKSRFFANISHDLRTPLTLILGPLETMLEKKRQSEDSILLNMIFRNANRLILLINELLELSRIENRMVQLRAVPLDLVSFLDDIIHSFGPLIKSQGVTLTFNSHVDELICHYDRNKMDKIICNLLSNAFKFTPQGGVIEVELSQAAAAQPMSKFPGNRPAVDMAVIRVKDSGNGIPASDIPYIFDRFYQVTHEAKGADRYKQHQSTGTGIGLALVKELVQLHHGRIDVESTIGEGTVFSLQIPVNRWQAAKTKHAKAPNSKDTRPDNNTRRLVVNSLATAQTVTPAPAGGPEPEQIDGTSSGAKVVVVEDNPDVRRFIRQQIGSKYEISEAANGSEGLKLIRKLIPDLVISDVMMPQMDGYQLCSELKSDMNTSHIPVILLTAKASQKSKIEGLGTGAEAYLTKPFSTTELMLQIRNLIAARKQLQEKLRRDLLIEPSKIDMPSMDQQFLTRSREIIEEYISDPDFKVNQLYRAMGMSRSTYHRKIQALTGLSPNEFIRSVRLKRAAQLLTQKSGNITDIAFEVGFNNSAYFTKCFKNQFGHPPSAYAAKAIGV